MNDKAAFKAGLFILLMVVLAIVMVIAIAGTGGLLSNQNSFTVIFMPGENVAALKESGQVRFLGVPVGSITSVEAVPHDDHGFTIEVGIQVPADFTIRDGAEVLASASLTGDAWIDFNSLGDGDAIADGGTLDGSVVGLTALVEQFASLVPDAKETLARIDAAATSFEELADSANKEVEPTADSIRKFTDRGAEAATEARDVLGDTKTDIRTTIANLREVTDTTKERLPETLARLDARLDETKDLMASAKESFDKLPGILDEIEPAAADAKRLLAQARATVADNRAKIDRTIASVTRTADDLKGTVSEIRAAPWRLIYKPDANDQRNLALYAAARQYAHGAQDLETAARALQTALEAPGADVDKITELRTRLVASYESFSRVQDDLWDQFQP